MDDETRMSNSAGTHLQEPPMQQPFGRYVSTIMERAAREAQLDGSPTIEAEHLLLAIAGQQERTTHEILASAGLGHQAIRDALDQEFKHSLGVAGVSVTDRELPPRAKSAKPATRLGASGRLVVERGVGRVRNKKDLRPAHLLLGVLRIRVGTVPRALALAGIDQLDLTNRVRRALPDEGE